MNYDEKRNSGPRLEVWVIQRGTWAFYVGAASEKAGVQGGSSRGLSSKNGPHAKQQKKLVCRQSKV